nr:DUF6791 domain-containing protein [Magnetospirillum fulvum]
MFDDVAISPVDDHEVYFTGEQPCTKAGLSITQIVHCECRQTMASARGARRFSNKRHGGYGDYFAKMDSYARLIESPVRSDNHQISARTFRPVETGSRRIDLSLSRDQFGARDLEVDVKTVSARLFLENSHGIKDIKGSSRNGPLCPH